MPKLNGRDTFFAMQEIDAKVPVILASGFLRDEALKEMKDAGLAGFIAKPYRANNLGLAVKKAMN